MEPAYIFLTYYILVFQFGLLYAGAQKNIGCAGVTVVIIRDDLIGHAMGTCPTIFDYKIQVGNNSCYNTPPTFRYGFVYKYVKYSIRYFEQ